jgi:hypothetical protein
LGEQNEIQRKTETEGSSSSSDNSEDLITPRGQKIETLKALRKEESERERKRDLTEKRRERKKPSPPQRGEKIAPSYGRESTSDDRAATEKG